MAKILIVDDSETLRLELKQSLEGAGHHIVEGSDGLEGLNEAKANSDIQLIISDYNMPQMDGYEVCRRLKSNPETADIPVIFAAYRTKCCVAVLVFFQGQCKDL